MATDGSVSLEPAARSGDRWPSEEARLAYFRQLGSAGGTATVTTHGRDHMRRIGSVGFAAYADNYHDGCRAAALAGLKALKPLTFARRDGGGRAC